MKYKSIAIVKAFKDIANNAGHRSNCRGLKRQITLFLHVSRLIQLHSCVLFSIQYVQLGKIAIQ